MTKLKMSDVFALPVKVDVSECRFSDPEYDISDKNRWVLAYPESEQLKTEEYEAIMRATVLAINNYDALLAVARLAAVLTPCCHNGVTVQTEAARVLAEIKAES